MEFVKFRSFYSKMIRCFLESWLLCSSFTLRETSLKSSPGSYKGSFGTSFRILAVIKAVLFLDAIRWIKSLILSQLKRLCLTFKTLDRIRNVELHCNIFFEGVLTFFYHFWLLCDWTSCMVKISLGTISKRRQHDFTCLRPITHLRHHLSDMK